MFQSTPPHGGRPLWGVGTGEAAYVSIHAPTWGATMITIIITMTAIVSIHAPTWGATHTNGVAVLSPDVSIHAPTWGATEKTLR